MAFVSSGDLSRTEDRVGTFIWIRSLLVISGSIFHHCIRDISFLILAFLFAVSVGVCQKKHISLQLFFYEQYNMRKSTYLLTPI